MSDRTTGWAWVAVQAGLLIGLIFTPGADHWPTPAAVDIVATGLFGCGFVVAFAAALRLGGSLTPTPVPNQRGSFVAAGLYRYVRHPIYTGVLLIVAGITIPSGSAIRALLAVSLVVFFHLKSTWEEARLIERYPEYRTYRSHTPRFVPRPH